VQVKDLIEELQKLDPELTVYGYDHEQGLIEEDPVLCVKQFQIGNCLRFGEYVSFPEHHKSSVYKGPLGQGVVLV
jgi:hypothetical protein